VTTFSDQQRSASGILPDPILLLDGGQKAVGLERVD
jgi:hypothetical protein